MTEVQQARHHPQGDAMSKATPGPWKVTDEHIVARDEYGGAQGLGPIIQTVNQRALEDCSPINVAFIVPIDTHAFEYPVGDSDANAALIAAAPALLAADSRRKSHRIYC